MMGIFLITDGLFRYVLLVFTLVVWIIVFIYTDKFILLSLGAREIIDSDNQPLFQALKAQTYRFHEKTPRVYLYSGHRLKCFVLDAISGWSIVLDRNLIKDLDQEQIQSLITYLIDYKKSGFGKIQTIGMGVMSIILRGVYWIWEKIAINTETKLHKIGVFISLVLIKPLFELVLKISKVHKKICGGYSLKSVIYQLDTDVVRRSFTEFMIYHLDTKYTLSELTIEFLEEFPVLENCYFKEST